MIPVADVVDAGRDVVCECGDAARRKVVDVYPVTRVGVFLAKHGAPFFQPFDTEPPRPVDSRHAQDHERNLVRSSPPGQQGLGINARLRHATARVYRRLLGNDGPAAVAVDARRADVDES